MSALYIHIPLCASRCYYCDFYSSTYKGNRGELIDALCKELTLRKDYLKGEPIRTIYFGGGTPSQLSIHELETVLNNIYKIFNCVTEEITIEANPEDLTVSYLHDLSRLPFNRLSIGIQSFHDEELKNINRRHTSQIAIDAVHNAQEAGFSNISIDLIYGLPNQTMASWTDNIEHAIALYVPHISAYSLTFEEKSILTKKLEKGEIKEIDEELSLNMFKTLRERLTHAGILPYEISNFARPGFESKHNSSYWDGTPYLGIGPSAHSFDGENRQWNIANTRKYIDNITNGTPYFEIEKLTEKDHFNEFILTGLRRSKGISLNKMRDRFMEEYTLKFLQAAKTFGVDGHLVQQGDRIFLSEDGIFISDFILSDLMIDEE